MNLKMFVNLVVFRWLSFDNDSVQSLLKQFQSYTRAIYLDTLNTTHSNDG